MTEACLMKLLLKLNDSSVIHQEQPLITKLLDLMWALMQVIIIKAWQTVNFVSPVLTE